MDDGSIMITHELLSLANRWVAEADYYQRQQPIRNLEIEMLRLHAQQLFTILNGLTEVRGQESPNERYNEQTPNSTHEPGRGSLFIEPIVAPDSR
jgi:hypothetical protein